MPLTEEEIAVLHPKHTVLKSPVSGFAPIWKEEICHMGESFLTIISHSQNAHNILWCDRNLWQIIPEAWHEPEWLSTGL